MAMGTRKHRQRQEDLWITHAELATAPGHPFYERVNELLDAEKFDEFAEKECAGFYAENNGRPSLTPGTYFRLLMIGYFEGLDSERGIAWRAADSLALRQFLRIGLDEQTPNHSTISRTRRLIDLETHRHVFLWVLGVLADRGLLKGRTVGVDATTLEANAAMRSIVRRDNGAGYDEFLAGLAQQSGIETPTREDLARVDRKRKKKGSNQEWVSPSDPDARITKMKDGTTHLAHKNEHAVDLETGAIVAPAVHPADEGDTTTMWGTLEQACNSLQEVREDETVAAETSSLQVKEVVVDKGYHSAQTLVNLEEVELLGYVSEPDRGRQKWTAKSAEQQAFKRIEQAAVYRNRRRRRGPRSKAWHRKRGELVERSFEHVLDDGGMRRVYLRGQENIAKRYLIHTAAFNLGLIMRKLTGFGTPRGWADTRRAAARGLCALWDGLATHLRRWAAIPATTRWPTVTGHARPLAA
jgi:transposase